MKENAIKKLKELSQQQPPEDVFEVVMGSVSFEIKANKPGSGWLLAASVAVLGIVFMLLNFSVSRDESLKNFEQLTEKVARIENMVMNNLIVHSEPGSELLEKIVSIESLLEQLNREIDNADNQEQKVKLMHAKLDVLGDLAALHMRVGARSEFEEMI